MSVRRSPRVVTVGGGHGQAALLHALAELECACWAVVSIADDGGCSGRLRSEFGIPPPGDVRRCIGALSVWPEVAALLERRIDLPGAGGRGRCVGNLILAELCQQGGSLTSAAAELGRRLGCRGTVIPVAEVPGTLAVFDAERGTLDGESQIEQLSGKTVVARVHGPEHATPEALAALAGADLILFGPGSFVGSTLAALTTADIAQGIATSSARCVLVRNIANFERTDVPGCVSYDDHERLLRDHLTIASGGLQVRFDVLSHGPDCAEETRADGSLGLSFPMADKGERMHEHEALKRALTIHFGLEPRPQKAPPPVPASLSSELEALAARLAARLRQQKRVC